MYLKNHAIYNSRRNYHISFLMDFMIKLKMRVVYDTTNNIPQYNLMFETAETKNKVSKCIVGHYEFFITMHANQ